MSICQQCKQEAPTKLSQEEYERRAIPRLKEIDRLIEKINFLSFGWEYTPEGERYKRLMAEQGQDEFDAGM